MRQFLLPTHVARIRRSFLLAVSTLALAGCASIDPKPFESLIAALDTMSTRNTDLHARVRRLQDAVYRAKVSLAPKLDEESLLRPGWLDITPQLREREETLTAVRDYVNDVKTLAGRGRAEQIGLSTKKLFTPSDNTVDTAKDVVSTAAVLQPTQPIFGTLLTKVFPQVGLVSTALAIPMIDRAHRSDVAELMNKGEPVIRARLDSLAPSNEALAEYVLALKTEYLPDAVQLRDQLALGDRYRYDQTMLDALAEFDAVAGQTAALSKTAALFVAAYQSAAKSIDGQSVSNDSLRRLLADIKATAK